jgi:hypothetical protein
MQEQTRPNYWGLLLLQLEVLYATPPSGITQVRQSGRVLQKSPKRKQRSTEVSSTE